VARQVFRILTIAFTFTLLMLFSATPILAFDAREGDTITISSGEVVDDDLYIVGGTITIDGTVNGDLWAIGNAIIVNGTVKGSVMAIGRTININGDVGHAVRAAGETVIINSDVSGDVMVGCGQVNIASPATVGGDLLLGAGNARIDGVIEGIIKGGGGGVTISGEVRGNVDLKVENLTILPTANIQGDLVYTSEEEADIQSGARIGGATTHNLPEVKERRARDSSVLLSGIGGKVIGFFMFMAFIMAFIVGLVIILLVPGRLKSMAESIRTRPGPSAGWGALALFVTPIAAVIVCFTIIGIPVGLIALALWGIAFYLAQIPVGLFIGRWIIGHFRNVEGKAIMIGALALGLAILRLLGLIPHLVGLFSGVGGFLLVWLFIVVAVELFGMGAVVVSIRKWRARKREAALA